MFKVCVGSMIPQTPRFPFESHRPGTLFIYVISEDEGCRANGKRKHKTGSLFTGEDEYTNNSSVIIPSPLRAVSFPPL